MGKLANAESSTKQGAMNRMHLPENKEEIPYALELFLDFVGVVKAAKPKVQTHRVAYEPAWKPTYQGQEPPF